MNYMELDIGTRSNLIDAINESINELEMLKPGSDEYCNQIDSVTKLYRLYLEEYGEEVERKKVENDWFIRERDIAIKESESRASKKWYNRFKWDTVINCGTILIGTGASIIVQTSGHVFPENFMRFIRMVKLH